MTRLVSCRTFQILFYALRPTFVRSQRLTRWHFLNIIAQAIFDYALISMFGPKPLIYLIASSFLAGSLHPCAGHFIAEHYLWDGLNQETFSYYGSLNILAYNVCPSYTLFWSVADKLANIRLVITTNTMTSLPSPGPVFPHSGRWHPSSTITSLRTHHGQWSLSTLLEIKKWGSLLGRNA